ncbi:MAG: hypothetical protein JW999_08290 [Methanotrichaceae archaeon]|nr:hypothetical protein [Methanotrichaceae archaeon]
MGELVLAALSPGKGNGFKMPLSSRPQRGLDRSPAIQIYFSNLMIFSAFSTNYQKALTRVSFTNYTNTYLPNKSIFGNGRKKDV